VGSRRRNINANRQVAIKMNHINEPRKRQHRQAELLKCKRRPQGEDWTTASILSSVGGVCVGDMSGSGVRINWEICAAGCKTNWGNKS